MIQLVCTVCGNQYPDREVRWKCDCGGLLDLDFHPIIRRDLIQQRESSMWRYQESLPIEQPGNVVEMGEGLTPLTPFLIGGRQILVKQDQLFPTGSYKDRGAAVLISKARELGVGEVVEDSSGNAGCAIAAWCARAGIVCHVYVPESTSPGKLVQIEMYGGRLVLVSGSREETARAVLSAAENVYYASHSWNPYFFHGTKTWAYEVWEQLGWKAPDTVILPVGNGTLLLGAYIGFRELLECGEIVRIPRMIAVQVENCAPLAKAFMVGAKNPPPVEKQDTLAEGIAIAEPVRGRQILEAVGVTDGCFVTVNEEEIENALINIASQGAYIEPTAAAAIAGTEKYIENLPSGEQVVTVFTGHGLKSTEKMIKLLRKRKDYC